MEVTEEKRLPLSSLVKCQGYNMQHLSYYEGGAKRKPYRRGFMYVCTHDLMGLEFDAFPRPSHSELSSPN